jgi:hypothetical protein
MKLKYETVLITYKIKLTSSPIEKQSTGSPAHKIAQANIPPPDEST